MARHSRPRTTPKPRFSYQIPMPVQAPSTPSEGVYTAFIADFREGALRRDIWWTFAVEDMQQRYRRSALGLAWILIGFSLFVGGVTLFFAGLTQRDPLYYALHVGLGFAAFSFLISALVEGCQVFTSARGWIKSVPLPLSIYVYKSAVRLGLVFLLQLVCLMPLLVLSNPSIGFDILLLIPVLVLFAINAICAQSLLGMICARLRDLTHLVQATTRLLLFVTPILWVRGDLSGTRGLIADLNPIAHYIEVFRAPILGEPIRDLSWIIVLCCTALVCTLTVLVGARLRRHIAFWV